MLYAATGHRPDKILGGVYRDSDGMVVDSYSELVQQELVAFCADTLRFLMNLDSIPDRITGIHIGMALGFDQAIGLACLQVNLPFIACIPCDKFESRWTGYQIRRYYELQRHAKDVIVVTDGAYHAWKLKRRNVYMVDESRCVLALWDGSTGGTSHTVKYAEGITPARPIVNVWSSWQLHWKTVCQRLNFTRQQPIKL
jgi:uncharacterized phage-like protein YoqJ